MSHATCPYSSRPDNAFWKRVVAGVSPTDVSPVTPPPFRISKTDRVATAGSCFAQHIARYLKSAGVEPFVTEMAPAIVDAETAQEYQYGLYSARYGNVYTTRQLLQLFDRAFGTFTPNDSAWMRNGRFFDPYRPSVQPEGFASLEELELDRQQHLRRVRRMFEELDVFVYTLGLTEAWLNKIDGAVYPVCPGCGWGEFDPDVHQFTNFSVAEVDHDLDAFLVKLRAVNPGARVILTVSPVPLAATAEDRHVLESTVLSKSVLRVAADQIQRRHDGVAYFPSYEIITGAFNRGAYYDTDLRTVLPAGVEHVMRTFFAAYLPQMQFHSMKERSAPTKKNSHNGSSAGRPLPAESYAQLIVDLICEEDQLDGPRQS